MTGTGEASLQVLREMLADGPVVVAAITAKAGSSPRGVGDWLIAGPDRCAGTVGGGEAERRTIAAAHAMLADGRTQEVLDIPLHGALDESCGGHLTLALRRLDTAPDGPFAIAEGGPVLADPAARTVIVYGAGHVGQALVRALAPLPFRLSWVDARPEDAWPVAGPVACRRAPAPETTVADAPDDAFHVVMTHSHAVDLAIVAEVLARPFGFLGLIGSAAKKAAFLHRLAERGLDTQRLTSPIGLNIPGKEPAVIAASVTAQLLMFDRPC
ncbi:xanthine dehydrogenase, chaperone [Stappia sp. 22II-S9-Z10]|nr:xanthine dehydrogenase, chaperone [Stappia sp. 22II-S9-Z10]